MEGCEALKPPNEAENREGRPNGGSLALHGEVTYMILTFLVDRLVGDNYHAEKSYHI